MLKDSVITELRAEAERLRKQAALIDAFLAGVNDERSGNGRLAMLAEDAETPEKLDPTESFASNVRVCLKSIGRTATSRQVAQHMISLGHPDERNGRPLRERVAVELFRMAQKEHLPVKKVSRGKYRYAKVSEDD